MILSAPTFNFSDVPYISVNTVYSFPTPLLDFFDYIRDFFHYALLGLLIIYLYNVGRRFFS